MRKQHPDDALQAADRALAKNPRDARLRLLRGNALVALGRVPEAIQAFTAMTTDFPSLPEPYNNLAALYAQQGQLDKARAALQTAMQTNRSYATAQANLADVYARLAAQAYDKALQRDIVERQNGQTAPSVTSNAPAKLALVQDLSPAATVARPTTNDSKPLVVAQAKPADTRPPEVKPLPKPAEPKPVVPVAQPQKPVETAAASKPQPAVNPKPDNSAASKPTVAASKPAVPDKARDAGKEAEEQIDKALHGWAEAWSAKKVPAYLAFYSRGFKPAGMSRNEWEKQRRERIEAARKIEVKLSNIKIKLDGERATVHLVQRYKSDKLDTSAGKTLLLEKVGGRWLISEERVG
ncbi:tetratricopeptide repeat protein [Chitinimonas sp.]|uniref:L,D-transpeptidase Cds6 family protein n=1 Tax=Chitinimonas sp. TaxID=1934313 RepID=UPI0035AF8D5D